MKVEKLTEEEKEEKIQEGELPKKSVRQKENRQLIWFFVIIGIVFMSFLGPYFYIQDSKTFEYAHIDWAIEDYESLRIYHGRFPVLTNPTVTFNTYLRTDPRENNIETVGEFVDFDSKAIISMSPEVDSCRGELSRVMLDLSSFLKDGLGVSEIVVGSTVQESATNLDRPYATCESVQGKTLVIVELGDESKVVQNENNKKCYTIYASSCADLTGAEKFIVKTVDDIETMLDEARAKKQEQ